MVFDDAATTQMLQDHEAEIRGHIKDMTECIENRDFDGAQEALSRAKELAPKAAVMKYFTGLLAFEEGKLEEACGCFEDAVEGGYLTEQSAYYLGSIYYYLDKSNQALEILSKAEILAKDKSRATELKADIFYNAGDYHSSLINARKLKKQFPDNSAGYHYEFISLLSLDNVNYAAETVSYAIGKFPDDKVIRLDLVNYYSYIEQYDDALKYLMMYEDSDEVFGFDVDVKTVKAKLLYNLGRYGEVDAVLTQLFTEYYTDEMAFFLMISLIYLENYKKALQCSELIISNKEDVGESIWYYAALYFRSLIYIKLGDTDRANELMDEANGLYVDICIEAPHNMELYLYRVLNCILMKNYEEAISQLKYMETILGDASSDILYIMSYVYGRLGMEDKRAEYEEKFNSLGTGLSKQIILGE